MKKLLALLLASAAFAYPQGATSEMSGIVTDPQGAAIPAADISVANPATGQLFKASTSEKGEWSVPALPPAAYRVTVTKAGFKTAAIENIVLNSGVPATVNAKLEIGQTSESVVVEAGQDILQTESATLSSTVQARQVAEIPFATRNAVELMVTQPGVSTPTNPRSSSINGLPRGALNVTIDGMNTQDNLLKSSDGFFSYIYTPIDAVEEITLSTSATDALGGGEGAANIRFVTRSGTNEFHGGVFWQNRNNFFNSNYYFNNINGLPRDIVNLNQFGGHVGGPVLKNKLFFFTNFETYRSPSTYNFTRQVLTPDAINGKFQYKGTDGVQTVNLYDVAAKANQTLQTGVRPFATTPDPIIASTLNQINSLVSVGNLKPRTATNNDYVRQDYNYQPHSLDRRYFSTSRMDYNVTAKQIFSVTYSYDSFFSAPDGLNSVVPIYAGTGTVLGSSLSAGQRSSRFVGIVSLRSVIKPNITNEFRAGLDGGTVLFRDTINDGLFSAWRGYNPVFGTPGSATAAYIGGVTSVSTPQRRNSPTKNLIDNVSWIRGAHSLSFGGNFSQVNLFQSTPGSVNSIIPNIYFGVSSLDPAFNQATNMFVPANFPGISVSDQGNASNLYAILTGRIASTTQGVSLGADGKYAFVPAIDRDRIRDYGLFAQDTWRLSPELTLTLGVRYEKQLPFENLTRTYSVVGYPGLWGTSGVGNLFKPGATGGVASTYTQIPGSAGYAIPGRFLPSAGLAWQLPGHDGLLKWITGSRKGGSVLRFGYGMNVVREGSAVFTSILGSNQGVNIDNSVDPANFPNNFGAAGSAWFRDPSLPSRPYPASPTYPIIPTTTTGLYDFDPNLKLGYVQSWNIGFQRELDSNTVVEARFTGNHGTSLWRQYNLNEVNIVENGFLNDFNIAANNLAIANGTTVQGLYALPSLKSTNFGNTGLQGQQNLSFIGNALGNTTDSTTANNLRYGQAGSLANSIAANPVRMSNLQKANPAIPNNFFQVNSAVSSGGSSLLSNSGSSNFNSLQIELRRRLSRGFLLQGSYVWSKSMANGASNSSSDTSQPTTLRNTRLDYLPSSFDIRHAFKVNGIWDLPFGPGRHFLGSVSNPVAKKAMEGWQLAGNVRIQSGTPQFLTPPTGSAGFGTFNQYSDGVVYHNMTQADLQAMTGIYKATNSNGVGIITYFPDSVITNTKAAFAQGGLTPATLDSTAKYIGPAPAGTVGYKAYVYLPIWRFFNYSVIKTTKITERVNLEFRGQCLNCFNLTNFQPTNNISSSFGQITAAYRDTSGTVDPGGRILEWVFRLNF